MIKPEERIGSSNSKSRLLNSRNGIKIGARILFDRIKDTEIGY